MAPETVRMTKEEKTRLKDQLLAFVERVSTRDRIDERMPGEVDALPAIVQTLLYNF